MAKIQKKFIADNAIDESKIELSNNAFLVGVKNGGGDQGIIKVRTDDALELGARLYDFTNAAPTADAMLSNKKYVDDQISSAITGLGSVMTFIGGVDASGALSQLDDSAVGDYYRVTTAGTLGGVELAVGDAIICHTAVVGTPADLSSFLKIDNTDLDNQAANEVPYNNSTSGLAAVHVQGAIDEVEGRLDTAETKLAGIEDGATADQTGAEIKSLYEAEADTNAFTDAEKSKLAGIEAGADVTDATNVEAAGAVMDADLIAASAGAADAGKPIKLDADGHIDASMINDADISLDNVTEGTTNKFFTATEETKLAGIEDGATADQTGAEIKSLYEAEADTNAYTDAEKTKLAGIEAGATADQSAAEVPYSNGTSGLAAVHVQGAIDEIEGRVDSLEAVSVPVPKQEVITLVAGDITNQYVTLAATPVAQSVSVSVSGVVQTPGVDFSLTGAQLDFAGDLAALLAAGDVLVIDYEN